MLALLTRDNTPDKPGPYRRNVAKALDFLVRSQGENGDLRGPPHLRGAGSSRGDMYDHAIATLALAEAAVMTGGDKRYAAAALRGAAFIVDAQEPQSGGWRYVPGEFGDTSVFGWQVMALHACEKLGFETPRGRARAPNWVRLATQGPRKMIATYQPRRAASPAMTAEMLYARTLLGHKFEPADLEEFTAFLASPRPTPLPPTSTTGTTARSRCSRHRPTCGSAGTPGPHALIALQSKGGPTEGSWNGDPKYGDRGGRTYMTSLALLTLEVYYRYERVTPPAHRALGSDPGGAAFGSARIKEGKRSGAAACRSARRGAGRTRSGRPRLGARGLVRGLRASGRAWWW